MGMQMENDEESVKMPDVLVDEELPSEEKGSPVFGGWNSQAKSSGNGIEDKSSGNGIEDITIPNTSDGVKVNTHEEHRHVNDDCANSIGSALEKEQQTERGMGTGSEKAYEGGPVSEVGPSTICRNIGPDFLGSIPDLNQSTGNMEELERVSKKNKEPSGGGKIKSSWSD
ncbi:hypothetical protein LXL04_021354 [Taraxacum kok-saghyz]